MKRLFLVIMIGLLTYNVFSQDKIPKVEKSIFGLQTGMLGVWVHNEYGLTNAVTLRTELGLDTGIFGGDYYDNRFNFILFPTVTLEPRYYYNLNKRVAKGKNIAKNSGNFLALKGNYIPDWFVISNSNSNIDIAENISVLVKWGIKRTLGEHFTYETGIGLGFRTFFLEQYGYQSNESEAAIDLHLRIGYTF